MAHRILSTVSMALGLLAATLAAAAEPVRDAKTGLAVLPLAGYAARVLAPTPPNEASIEVKRTDDTGVACRIAFRSNAESAKLTQEQMNQITARPDWLVFARGSLSRQYEVRSESRFEHMGIGGGAFVLDPKAGQGASDMRLLTIWLETPRGRTTINCLAPTGAFDARRPEFEALARNVSPVR
jgi:hypothetical protein